MSARLPLGAHIRENRGVLASAERKVLIWLAERMPSWVSSDHLTALGLVSMLTTGLAFFAMRWWPPSALLVCVALAMNWFGDSLDGTLARVRNQQRPRYGFYVDHIVDLLGSLFLFGGLALSGFMSPLLALGLLVGYLMVSAESYLATHTLGRFRISFAGFGPTELRIVLAVGALWLMRSPWASVPGFGVVRLFDVGGMVALIGLAVAFLVSSVRNTRALYLAEPIHPR